MTTILVPIDGSKNALRAVDHAARQARAMQAVIHVLNVQPAFESYGTVPAYVSETKHRALTTQHGKALLEAAAKRLASAGVPYETHVAHGDVAPTIVRVARRLKCGAIVMGTRGHSAIENLFLGSVATKVIHLTNIPVTLVK